MADYKNISIDVTENGFIITAGEAKKFVFSDCDKMREWIMENLSVTGEVERFSDALDDKSDVSYDSSSNDSVYSKFVKSLQTNPAFIPTVLLRT
jgi:hypothetical protein